MNCHTFCNGKAACDYALAGNATLTLSSLKTGARYTYRVRQPREGNQSIRFLSLLTGSDNENSYSYLGLVRDGQVVLTAKSKMAPDSKPVAAFRYFLQHAMAGAIAPSLEVRHEGKCGRCGRKLTVPESIDAGIGPECAKRFN
jgi:hypothetical protein